MIVDLIGWTVALLGAGFVAAGAIGIVRLPDLFTRMHAAGLIDSLGAALVLVGLCIVEGFSATTSRLLMVLAFLWITTPTACHALAKSALATGQRPWMPERPPEAARPDAEPDGKQP
jgi:multicomponent Na+:H+ antiporter subunit G